MSTTIKDCGCSATGCGIGTGNVPKPGDPDNSVAIFARTVSGGIQVTWTYPRVNSHAVAYITLFRGLTNKFSEASELGKVAGSNYFDPLTPDKQTIYYYWIQITSVNGTTADTVGPASAYAKSKADNAAEGLTAEINEGHLAEDLRTKIDQITMTRSELLDSIAKYTANNEALTKALADVRNGVTESIGLVNESILTTNKGQDALATRLNVVAAVNSDNAAAILEERTARVAADSAHTTLITNVQAQTANAAAAVLDETNARTTADSALASQISTVQSTLNGNIASAKQTMETRINELTGEIDAMITFKVDVNGNVGGFGVYGTGQRIEAGFDVDRFWIGRNGLKTKPFIIDNGIVYIDKAKIREADIETLHIADGALSAMQSNTGTASTNIPVQGIRNLTSASVTMSNVKSRSAVLVQGMVGIQWNAVRTYKADEGWSIVTWPPDAIWIQIVKNGSAVYSQRFPGGVGAVQCMWVDMSPTNGTNTYTINISNDSSNYDWSGQSIPSSHKQFWAINPVISVIGMKR